MFPHRCSNVPVSVDGRPADKLEYRKLLSSVPRGGYVQMPVPKVRKRQSVVAALINTVLLQIKMGSPDPVK